LHTCHWKRHKNGVPTVNDTDLLIFIWDHDRHGFVLDPRTNMSGRPLRLAAAAVAAILVLTLPGCGTPAEQTAAADRAGSSVAAAAVDACLVQASAQPVYVYLAQHFSMTGPTGDTQMERSDQAVASLMDVQMLKSYRAAVQACEKAPPRISPAFVAFAGAIDQARILNDENLATLISRQESWGEFVTTRDAIAYKLPLSLDLWAEEASVSQPFQMYDWQSSVTDIQTQLSDREGRVVAW
jgi:hypothetical protein